MAELFVGMTTWNDGEFVKRSLPALQRTLAGVDAEFVAWDNGSRDGVVEVIRSLGVRCVVRRCAQGDALNGLLAMSSAPYTLLVHSDVFMLSPDWFPLLKGAMTRSAAALISPEDIGLGNMRRSRFSGMPESSFLFFDTAKARACMAVRPLAQLARNLIRCRYVRGLRGLNLDVSHITHALPGIFRARGYSWVMMRPLTSRLLDQPWFTWDRPGESFSGEMARYEYGDGNFYEFEGVITHYHNWLARFFGPRTRGKWMTDAYVAYGQQYTARFFAHFDTGMVHLPAVEHAQAGGAAPEAGGR